MPKGQVGAMEDSKPRMLLKTIRALTRPRGFESHALRPTPGKLVLTWDYGR
jgi:hypothetical protein